jgi:hypothetical protein
MSTTTWDTKKAVFQTRFDRLNSTTNVSSLVTQLNNALRDYIQHQGDSTARATDYNNITTLSQQLQTIKTDYATLNDDIIKALQADAANNNLSGSLTTNAGLQTVVNNLEKKLKELQVEADTAVVRDELLRSRDTNLNAHQLFLLDRPVRKGMIPFLWALSVLCIGIGLIVYKMMLPPIVSDMGSTIGVEMSLADLLLNKTVLISLLVCIIIIIVVISLKVGGVIGK